MARFGRARRLSALLLVLCLAFGVRLYGFWFGLPYVLSGDGENTFINPAVQMVVSGDLNPHWFGHPGSTVIYPLALVYGLIYTIGHAAGRFDQAAALQTLLASNPTPFYLIARLLSIAWAVATVALLWRLGTRLGGRGLGLLAALFLALNPMHREWTTWARTDAPAAFCALAASTPPCASPNGPHAAGRCWRARPRGWPPPPRSPRSSLAQPGSSPG